MNLLNLTTPKFLKEFDTYLILQHPYIWRTRFHFVLFFALLGGIVFFLIGLFIPLSMYTLVKENNVIVEIKHSALLFGLILAIFITFFWWSRVARHKTFNTKWYQNIIECSLYYVCLFTLWQAINAFNSGIDANIAYRIDNNLSNEDLQKLNQNNFFIPSYMPHNPDYCTHTYNDSIFNEDNYYKTGELLLSQLQNKINKDSISRDSQYAINTAKTTLKFKGNFFRFRSIHTGTYLYRGFEWFIDSVKSSNKKIKSITQRRDSFYLLMNKKDKFKADSILNASLNEFFFDKKKDQSANYLDIWKDFHFNHLQNIIDTNDYCFLRKNNFNLIDYLSSSCENFEFLFRKNTFISNFNSSESKNYTKYLTNILATIPKNYSLHDRYNRSYDDDNNDDNFNQESTTSLFKIEASLFSMKDSLALTFLKNLDAESYKEYSNLMKFINSSYPLNEKELESLKIILWNKRMQIRTDLFNYYRTTFIDSLIKDLTPISKINISNTRICYDFVFSNFNYFTPIYENKKHSIDFVLTAYQTDSIIRKLAQNEYKNTPAFQIEYNKTHIKNYKSLEALREMDKINHADYYEAVERYNMLHFIRKNRKDKDFFILNEKLSEYIIENINLDSLRQRKFGLILQNLHKEDSVSLKQSYINYFTKKLNDKDSIFLNSLLGKNCFIPNALYKNRLYLLSSTQYLLKAVMIIEKTKSKLKGWLPFNLSKMVKLSLLVLTLIFFFTTSSKENLFIAIFFSFFIVFFIYTIPKTISKVNDYSQDAPIYMLFGVLSILSFITLIHIFFYKYKIAWVSTLIGIQLFSLLGVFVWVFNDPTIESGYDKLLLYCSFFLLIALFYRKYLSLPIKK